MERFHYLDNSLERPARMNDPLDYVPHALCQRAAEVVKSYIATLPETWQAEVAAGKMMGVLVCEDAEGRLGFVAAYSGQIGGREDWPWFVPAVFDYLQPDGYFKEEEGRISALNAHIEALQASADFMAAKTRLQQLRQEADVAVADFKMMMQEAKARRDARRRQPDVTAEEAEAMVHESQHQKAELRRLKGRWRERLGVAEAQLRPMADAIGRLREERRRRSDALQRWLFDHFVMLNTAGVGRTLTDIFRATPQGVPPAGSGECCAPKLLQYAFLHGLRPLQIAEFWQGRSPKMEIRHHDHFYTACRGKCKPILEWMLGGDVKDGRKGKDGKNEKNEVDVLFADEAVLVVAKPAGMLTVPGRSGAPSVESWLRERYGEVHMVHRLDMDTSGLLVVARTLAAYHSLQRQFLARTIYKRYMAWVEGVLPVGERGTISLPLRPDPDDRPRQLVDHEHGRTALTRYEVLRTEGGRTLLWLEPHTGRTHQLRMHCAHSEGLGMPIVGDALYGRRADRLWLHAAELHFRHPVSGEEMRFEEEAFSPGGQS